MGWAVAGWANLKLYGIFHASYGVHIMNNDQVKGSLKDAAGKVQEQAGKLVGNEEQQAKGVVKQAEGKVQKTYGDGKENVKDGIDKM